MNVAKAPEPEREPVPRSRHVRAALVGGFVAWLPLALGGQLLAWTAYALTRSFRPWSWVKVGLLNTLAVARVPFETRADPPRAVAVEPTLFASSMEGFHLTQSNLLMLDTAKRRLSVSSHYRRLDEVTETKPWTPTLFRLTAGSGTPSPRIDGIERKRSVPGKRREKEKI